MRTDVLKHFQKVDPILSSVASRVGEILVVPANDIFRDICSTIVGQQLSTKAADTIWSRVVSAVGEITPENILQKNVEDLRLTGISRSKASFILDLAARVKDGRLDLTKLRSLSQDEVVKTLTEVKGIGPWTAEMVLMFTLGHEDIFSTGDLGLKRAIEKLYNLESATKEDMLRISAPWAPYRTFASRVLWKSLDLKE